MNGFARELRQRGISRRDFITYCGAVAAALGLERAAAAKIAAVLAKQKPKVVWLEFQDCAGCTESFLRASHPTVSEIVLDVLSVDYHETIMAAAGHRAEAALAAATKNAGEYLCIVEGAIPTADGACTVGGKSALDTARRVVGNAMATIAVGTCASYGGLPAAAPNPTGAMGVDEAVPGAKNLINLPACPVNAENLTALVVHFLAFKKWPPLDRLKRPLFAYGQTIHDNCERRAHFDAGQYVEAWGDAGHRAGYCLYKMGCKGPVCFHNCPNVGWNGNTNWPVGCGHPCIGCAEPAFWDRMTPFYVHLAGVPFGIDVDKYGLATTGLVGAGIAAHGLVRLATRATRQRRQDDAEAKRESVETLKEGAK
jgi:hydrogenase small subunit